MKTIAVVIAGGSQATEALRAAVGLTLRGDRVVVVPRIAWPDDVRGARALATLRALGHRVDGTFADVEAADVVEVWTATAGEGAPPPESAPPGKMRWLVRTRDEAAPPGAIVLDDAPVDVLIDLIFAADRVAVWGSAAPAETLDLVGEVCPFTFVRTKLRLEELPTGARLRVVVDHEPATRNIPRSAAEWGQRVLRVEQTAQDRWEIWIEKGTSSE